MRTIFKLTTIVFLYVLNSHSYGASIKVGDLLISEVMANPFQVNDTNGEWFEIFNASANPIDINGITISDNGSNLHSVNHTGSLLLQAGNFFVFGRNGDNSINGGYIADYVYDDFTLANTSDQIILSKNSIELARLDYSGLPFGEAGISAELIIQSANPTSADYQLTQNSIYGLGDIGTPGNEGSVTLNSASPVPIPSAFWLFTSAIALLIKRSKTINQTNLQSSLSN